MALARPSAFAQGRDPSIRRGGLRVSLSLPKAERELNGSRDDARRSTSQAALRFNPLGGVSGNGISPRGDRLRFSRHRGQARQGGQARRGGRLLRTRDFEAVYRGGERRAGGQFAAYFRPNGLGRTRFGISVGRALGNAVRRNRIRRRIREILRLHRGEIASGWDIVIHPRSSVATAEFARLTTELVGLLRSAVGASEPSPRG